MQKYRNTPYLQDYSSQHCCSSQSGTIKNKVKAQQDSHSWKCYVNKDIELQYHRLMIDQQLQPLPAKRDRLNIRSSSSNAFEFRSARQSSRQPYIPKKTLKDTYIMTAYQTSTLRKSKAWNLDKRQMGYERGLKDFYGQNTLQKYSRQNMNDYQDFPENQDSPKFIEDVSEYNQDSLSRARSLNSFIETGSNEYDSNLQKKLRDPYRKTLLQTTIANDSLERTISQQMQESKEIQLAMQVNRSRNSEDFRIPRNKMLRNNRTKQEEIGIKNITKREQETQTKQVVILEPHVHEMQEEERQYLRDEFMNHYGLVHKKKF